MAQDKEPVQQDQARRDELLSRPLSRLESKALAGFGAFLARQRLDGRSLADLDAATRAGAVERLRQSEAVADSQRLEGLADQRLPELDGQMLASVGEALADRIRADLAQKVMEEPPDETRLQIHQALDERNYFVDPEKVRWY